MDARDLLGTLVIACALFSGKACRDIASDAGQIARKMYALVIFSLKK